MRGIVLATDNSAPPPPLYKKFIECAQALADEKGMQHLTNSFSDLKDLEDDDFKPLEVDVFNCTMTMNARKTDSNGNPLLDIDGKPLMEEVTIITKRDAYERACELQQHRIRKKEDKQQK